MKIVDFQNISEKDDFDRVIVNDRFSFIQQTTAWADITSPISNDIPVFCFEKKEDYFIGASLYLFECEFGNILVSNIQAGSLGCFCFAGDEEKRGEAYETLIEEILKYAERMNCISVTFTSNPYSQDEEIIRSHLNPDAGMSTFISVINIKDYFDTDGNITLTDYNRRSNLSRNLKKSYLQDFEFKTTKNPDDILFWYENIHRKRILELNGKPLPYELFSNMTSKKEFGTNYVFFTVYKNNRMAAGDLCIFGPNGNFDNYMMSTDSSFLAEGINYFLVDKILKWCFSNNITIYNWQSSNPPHGGIFNFKQQWGSKILPYWYFVKVIDRARFEDLFDMDIAKVMNRYSGHFLVPYKTLLKGEYGFFNKDDVNRSVNIHR